MTADATRTARVLNRSALLAAANPDDRARRAVALDVVDEVLAGLDAQAATAAVLARWAAEDPSLPERPWTVFALGKAAAGMARAALGWRVTGGLLLGEGRVEPLRTLPAAHPLPHPDAAASGRTLLAAARRLGTGDHALVLVSGGGSAMATAPVLPAEEWAAVQRRLLLGGASIGELNTVRRRLDRIKDGGLARALAPAAVRTVVLSDVPGLGPEWVASGPTLAATGGPDPRAVLAAFGLDLPVPPPSPPPAGHPVAVAADNALGQRLVAAALARRGLPVVVGEPLVGEARAAGAVFAASGATVAGGETTVTVRGDGVGGRNAEFLLGAGGDGLVVALATDGVDGVSDGAGGLWDASARQALGPARIAAALARSDAGAALAEAGAQLRTGPTGTNVADLAFRLP